MSFFDDIQQPEVTKKEAPNSFFPSVGNPVPKTVKTPIKPVLEQTRPIVPTVQTTTPMFSSKTVPAQKPSNNLFSMPVPEPKPSTTNFFSDFEQTQPEKTQPQAKPSFFDVFDRKETVAAVKPASKTQELFDKYAPKIVKDVATQLSEGLKGSGQQIDFAGNMKEDTGLLGGLFGSYKSTFAKVNDRAEQLKAEGVPEARINDIAKVYAKYYSTKIATDPIAFVSRNKTKDKALAELELSDKEKTALNKVGFFETVNKALDSLNFTGIGSIGTKNIAKTIAKETYKQPIKDLLLKEIKNMPDNLADELSQVLSKVNDEKEVAQILDKVDFSINKYKAPAPLPDEQLATEAKKYKSAEEFVKAQVNLNHASAGEIKEFVSNFPNQRPVFLTKDGNYYKEHIGVGAKNNPVKVEMGKTITLDNKTLKQILNTGDDLRAEQFNFAHTKERNLVFDWLKKNGYDSATIPRDWHRGNEFRESIVVFNPSDQIKTKSQLTDIWNKANTPSQPKAPVYRGEKDLTTIILKDLEGKSTVSKQYILDATNRPELKQTEKDIVRQVLEQYPVGATVPVKEFAEKVKTELLPLNVNNSFVTGNDLSAEQAEEAIKSGKKVYGMDEFMGELVQSDEPLTLEDIGNHEGYILKGNENGFTPKYEQVSLPVESRGEVKNYKENIYESPVKTSAGDVHFSGNTGNYFGHTRIEDMADDTTRRVIEVQSDLYQKGRLEEDANKLINRMTEAESEEYNALKEIQEGGGSLEERDVAWEKMKKIRNEADKRPNTPNKKLAQYSNPTAHFRMVREEIKKAAQDGKTKLQFPTGETAMKIEGLGEAQSFGVMNRGTGRLMPISEDFMTVGMKVVPLNQAGDEWIITDILGDGKFKAVSKANFDAFRGDDLTFEEALEGMERSEIETFDISGKVDTNNPIYRFYEKDLGRYLTSKYQAKLVTDKQGVKWYEVDVKPEEAKKPVTAFKKPLFTKMSGPLVDLETAKKLIFKDIPEKDVRLIFTDKLIKGNAVGEYNSHRDLMKGVLKPIIQLYEEGGKVEVTTAFHESGHYLFDNFLTKEQKRIALDLAKKEISIIDRADYFIKGYRGEDNVLEEYLMDKYAEQKAKDEGFTGPYKTFFEQIDEAIRKIIATAKEVFARVKEQFSKTKTPQSSSKFKRVGNKAEYDKPLSKEEKLDIAKKAMQEGEAKYAVDKSKIYQIETTGKEDRLLVERGIQELNKITKKESFLESLKIKIPKELQDRKEALTFEKEALQSNPARSLVPYMARRGQYKGSLPEVTGDGSSTFATRGDDIVTELGYKDSEEARNAFDKYIEAKKRFEDKLIEYQKDRQDFLQQARKKRDEIITEKKVELATAKTEKHIGELIGDKQNKEKLIKEAAKREADTQAQLKEESLQLNKYQKMVEEAQVGEATKKSLLSKFKAVFSPISQTDEVTKNIYLDWEVSKLRAKETGNKIYEQFKAKPENDIKSIMEYEAGKKTQWIREAFDDAFTQARRKGLGIGYKEDYVPHVYNETPAQIKEAVVKYMEDQKVEKAVIDEFKTTGEIPEVIAIRLKVRPNFQKIRTFPDYATAMKYNLTPKFNTVAEHLAYYYEEMDKAVANKKLIDDLIAKGKILDSFDAPDTWIEVKLPGRLRRSYYAQKNLADALNGQFRDEDNLNFLQEAQKRLANLSQFAQSSVLTGGVPETTINNFAMGQAIRMLTTGVGEAAKLNMSGASSSVKAAYAFIRGNFNNTSIKWFKENQYYIDLMIDNNLQLFRKASDYDQNYKTWKNLLSAKSRKDARISLKTVAKDIKAIRGPQTLGKAFTTLMDSRAIGLSGDIFNKSFSDKTFSNMMPQMQIQIFKDIYEGAIKDKIDSKQAAEFAAKIVKNEFGATNDLGRTQNVKDVFNSYFFAPRFREGMINIFVNGAKAWTTEFKNPTFARSRSLVVGMIITYIMYNYLNQQLNDGDNMWENEPGREFALKIPLPNGRIIYTDFMPSSLAFIRNIGSGGLAFLRGDSKTATQKFGTLFSIPIKIATEIVGNKDYFGRPIYEVTDPVLTKAKKAAEHLGLGIAHPYIRELTKFFEGKQDIYQTLSMMMELPIKFSTEEKSIIARQYEEKAKKAELNKRERAKIADTIETYDKVQQLKIEGNIGAIETIINGMSEEQYQEYKMILKYDQIQALKKAKKTAQATALGDSLTDQEYLQYQAIKTIRTSQKKSVTEQKKVDAQKKPAFDSNTKLDERTVLESVRVYANAIGTDPVTAFNRIFTGQRIRYIANNAIVVERIPLFESEKIKKERGATKDLKLDHTVPLSLGGSNDENNLKLVPVDEWKSYTPVESYLSRLLKNNKISREEAQRLIIDFKNGKLKAEDILKL